MIDVNTEIPVTKYEDGMRYTIVLNNSVSYLTERALKELYKKIGKHLNTPLTNPNK